MRTLIADASVVYRNMFKTAITAFDKDAVLDFATDSNTALDRIKNYDYDIAILDVEIPGAGMLEILQAITADTQNALPVIIARPSTANALLVEAAMASGAAFCITKLINDAYDSNIEMIREKMESVYAMRRSEHSAKPVRHTPARVSAVSAKVFIPDIIMIASSTGGPAALETILSGLGSDLPVPVIIVQHIPPHFMENLSVQLQNKTRLKVKIAEKGETLKPGTVYLAAGGIHTRLDKRKRIIHDNSPPVNGVRPSADVLFQSVSESFQQTAKILVVVLTGMGCDGEYGIEKLKESHSCFSIVQSEKTCVVYGMPRAVVENNLADAILDIDKIASALMEMVSGNAKL